VNVEQSNDEDEDHHAHGDDRQYHVKRRRNLYCSNAKTVNKSTTTIYVIK